MGVPGSRRPMRPRRTARDTARTASSCPMMRLPRRSSILRSFSASLSSIRAMGMPVHSPRTRATSSSPTMFAVVGDPSRTTAASAASSLRLASGMSTCSSSPSFAKSCRWRASPSCDWSFAYSARRALCAATAPRRDSSRARISPTEGSSEAISLSIRSRVFTLIVSRSSARDARCALSEARRRIASSTEAGTPSISTRLRAAASSSRSIALSGSARSYR